jgi:hypothetical protein
MKNVYIIFAGKKMKGIDHLGELGFSGKIILKSIQIEWGVRKWTGIIRLRTESSGGLL